MNLDNETSNKKTHLQKSSLVTVDSVFNAPIERVWEAWSNEKMMMQWWGPEGFSSPSAKIDFRIGGKSLLAMKDPKGEVVWSGGAYKEILLYKKIVTTDYFADENGKIISAKEVGMPGEWPLECVITIDFTILDKGQVQMTINHEGIPKEMHDDCVEGWTSSLRKLKKLLERH